MAQTSLMTDSTSPPPHALSRSSHLSVRTERVMPMTVSRSRLPPPSLYTSRIPSMTSITTALSGSGYAYSLGVTEYTVSPPSDSPMRTEPMSVMYDAIGRSSGTEAIQQSVYDGFVRTFSPMSAVKASENAEGLPPAPWTAEGGLPGGTCPPPSAPGITKSSSGDGRMMVANGGRRSFMADRPSSWKGCPPCPRPAARGRERWIPRTPCTHPSPGPATAPPPRGRPSCPPGSAPTRGRGSHA